jgi:hypothetical protein
MSCRSASTLGYLATLPDQNQIELESLDSFTDRYAPVQSISGSTVTMQQPAWANNNWGYDVLARPFEGGSMFLENSEAFLQQAGQWSIDSATGQLFYEAPAGHRRGIRGPAERHVHHRHLVTADVRQLFQRLPALRGHPRALGPDAGCGAGLGGGIVAGGVQTDAHHPSNPAMTDQNITISNNLVSGTGPTTRKPPRSCPPIPATPSSPTTRSTTCPTTASTSAGAGA